MAVSGIDLDFGFTVVAGTSLGVIAGEAPGIVTIDNVPGRAEIDLFRRSDRAWLRRQFSMDNGTYRFSGLSLGVLHDLVARDVTDTWDDVIAGRVSPFVPVRIAGDAPGARVGQPYSYAYQISGGEAPFTFELIGTLPAGLALETTATTAALVGTPSAETTSVTWSVKVTDSRAAESAVSDSMEVFSADSHKYWRVNVTASNGFCTVGELEMASVSGGGNLCVAGTPLASGQYPNGGGYTYDPANAFDGVIDGATNCWSSANSSSGWIGYNFAHPVDVKSVRISPRSSPAQSPRDFTIEWSDDGVSWTVAATYTGRTTWTAGVLTPFAV